MTYHFTFQEIARMNFTEITAKLSLLNYTGVSHIDSPPPDATKTYQYFLYYGKKAINNKFGGGLSLTIAARNDTNETIFNFSHGGNPFIETKENVEYEKDYLLKEFSEINNTGNLTISVNLINWYIDYVEE
ncbi:MAG: hypothetical protein QXU48_00330 [Thermoplasmata archaeon]